jgi:hypothetical protein
VRYSYGSAEVVAWRKLRWVHAEGSGLGCSGILALRTSGHERTGEREGWTEMWEMWEMYEMYGKGEVKDGEPAR